MNKILTPLIFFYSIGLLAQQSPQSSLYSYNIYDFNTAIAGVDEELSVNGDIRRQWVGLVGAPLTQSVNAHLPIYFIRGGFGLALKSLSYGVTQNIQATLGYNQLLRLNEQATLSIGISGGLMQHNFGGSEIRTASGSYEPGAINHNDQELSEFDGGASAPVLSAGAVLDYYNFRIGLSADNLLESKFVITSNQNNVTFNQIRHYYGYVSYVIDLDNDLRLTPSLFVKAESAELQSDFNISADFKEKFILGFSYRGYNNLSSDAMIFQGGFQLSNNLRLVYAYDFGLSELKNTHSGSHEILISYNIATNFGKGSPPQIIYNPRFL